MTDVIIRFEILSSLALPGKGLASLRFHWYVNLPFPGPLAVTLKVNVLPIARVIF